MKTSVLIANKKNFGARRTKKSIKYIVIHYTSNDGDKAINNAKFFQNNITKSSAHYFVDDVGVVKSVYLLNTAWSVGGKKYPTCNTTGGGKFYNKCTNANSINIELCDTKKNGVIYPSIKTINNALKLTRRLMKEYHVPKENVIRHFDVTGKPCPAYWTDLKTWKKEFWSKL